MDVFEGWSTALGRDDVCNSLESGVDEKKDVEAAVVLE
jgi:hypothetical protein